MTREPDYRMYLLDDNRRFCAVEEFVASDDEAALARAREILAATEFPAAEVWQRARQVAVVTREEIEKQRG